MTDAPPPSRSLDIDLSADLRGNRVLTAESEHREIIPSYIGVYIHTRTKIDAIPVRRVYALMPRRFNSPLMSLAIETIDKIVNLELNDVFYNDVFYIPVFPSHRLQRFTV